MENKKNTLPGPVFEAGPGWGEKIGRWIKDNALSKILPVFATIVLLAGIAKVYSKPSQPEETPEDKLSQQEETPQEILVQVRPRDGIVFVSRRALDEYLKEFPELKLKPEERLHIENIFLTKFKGVVLSAGQEVAFLKTDLAEAINEALQLSEGKRQKLRAYIK
ncbi:MAG: hypothetical protein Q7S32_02860 [bacterium]|nr:hypothetical protein [bacterium]